MSQIYEGLMKFRPSSLEVEPCLASHYEMSDDGLVSPFICRKTFSSKMVHLLMLMRCLECKAGHGKADTSYYADLVWGNVRRSKNLAATLCVYFERASGRFSYQFSTAFGGSMVSPNATDLKNNPIGTGPYN